MPCKLATSSANSAQPLAKLHALSLAADATCSALSVSAAHEASRSREPPTLRESTSRFQLYVDHHQAAQAANSHCSSRMSSCRRAHRPSRILTPRIASQSATDRSSPWRSSQFKRCGHTVPCTNGAFWKHQSARRNRAAHAVRLAKSSALVASAYSDLHATQPRLLPYSVPSMSWSRRLCSSISNNSMILLYLRWAEVDW